MEMFKNKIFKPHSYFNETASSNPSNLSSTASKCNYFRIYKFVYDESLVFVFAHIANHIYPHDYFSNNIRF